MSGMPVQSILIADSDPGTIRALSCTLLEHMGHLAIDTCASAEELSQKIKSCSYNTIAVHPLFLSAYRSLRKKHNQLLAPLLVTVSQRNLMVAQAALDGDVFDLIARPIVPHEAAQTVRWALWHNQLLLLLASRERAAAVFQQHLDAFPHDDKREVHRTRNKDTLDRTFQAVQASLRVLMNIEEDKAFFDLASVVEHCARQRALDRLLTLCTKGIIEEDP